MKMLSERTPGELFDDPIRLKRLWEPEDCWKCGTKIGQLHEPGCSFDFCRRSGIQNFGERPCFCDMGSQCQCRCVGAYVGAYEAYGPMTYAPTQASTITSPVNV